ncbi:MAG: AhpC/TSA family protein [Cyanobacteria bacterium SZAS-4]|nr:AhpC/TSA family protein [Cyanobacteria bacterium SZAS-4]
MKNNKARFYVTLVILLIALIAFMAIANSDGAKGSGESRADAVNTAIKTGDAAPDFELKNPAGKTFRLSEALSKGPVILAFYRGGWCPFCNKQLHDLQVHLTEFKKLGAELVAVSPQTPEKTEWTETKNQLTFTVLSDPDNAIAKKYHLVYRVGAATNTMYRLMGIDIAKNNGSAAGELPVPATYLINTDGKIVFAFVDENVQRRADSEDILNALKARH